MAKDEEKMVRVPEEMYKKLERRAMRATEIEELLLANALVLSRFDITAVITNPPSGEEAQDVLIAVQSLCRLATRIKGSLKPRQ